MDVVDTGSDCVNAYEYYNDPENATQVGKYCTTKRGQRKSTQLGK